MNTHHIKTIIKFFILLLNLLLFNTITYAADKTLNVYTWSGYLSEPIMQLFEQQTGIRINHSTYLSNEVLYSKLKANPDSGYDIIMPSTYFVNIMVKQNLIQKIDKTKLTNFKNLNPIFLNQEYDKNNEYSLPYVYLLTGIAINKKYHPEINETSSISWSDLWNPKYKDQLLIFDDTRETFAISLMKLGYSINDTDPNHIKAAFETLNNLMGNIKLFNTEAQHSIYLDEDITIGMGWNGDLYLAREENPNLTLIYPKEGFLMSLDCITIAKGAKHVNYAHQFIDFILQASIAKEIALFSGFSTPNLAGKKLLPNKLQSDPMLYPNAETMKRAKILNNIGDAAFIYEKYFELLRS